MAPSPSLVFFLFLHSSLLSGLVQPSYHLHFSTQWTYHHQSLPSLFISFWPHLKPINWSHQEHTCGPTNPGWFNLLQQGRKLSRNVASHQTGKALESLGIFEEWWSLGKICLRICFVRLKIKQSVCKGVNIQSGIRSRPTVLVIMEIPS